MNRTIPIIAIAAASIFSGAAFAESPLAGVDTKPFVSTRSRAEVIAELHEYKRVGINPWSMAYNPLRTFKSTATREAVTAQYLNSRNEVAAFQGEDSGSAYLAQSRGSQLTNVDMARGAAPLDSH